jgi:hypothetical protein
MPKKKQQPGSIWQSIGKMHWSIKTVTAALAFFVGLGSAAATWDSFGWWHPASIIYVNEQLKPILRELRANKLDLANSKRENTETDIAKFQLELKKAQDDDSRALINKTLKTLGSTKDRLDKQIDILERDQ